MRAKRRRAASPRNSDDIHEASCSLLALPVGVLHQVLGMLGPDELKQLLHTSKAMAEQVMQHSAGRLTLKVDLHKTINWAAIRQLLHWAPTSCLKLMLVGIEHHSTWAERSQLRELFHAPCSSSPGHNSHQMQHPQMQQLPCKVEVHVQDFTLPSLVPEGIAALCPYLHTLRLTRCVVMERSRDAGSPGSKAGSSSKAGSVRASSSQACSSSIWPAQRLHALTLEESYVPYLQEYPAGNTRVTRSMQPAVQYAEQLKSSLPNLTCLTLQGCSVTRQLLAMFGPQLTELHLPSEKDLSDPDDITDLRWPAAAIHLRHLQKLMLPHVKIACAAEVELLLSLPSLTHLEINSVSRRLEDCSSHPCKWQYLHLHLKRTGLRLEALAKLPLPSLTHPLVLGTEGREHVLLQLPPPDEVRTLPDMKRLAQQLTKCGVNLLTAGVAWEPGDSIIVDDSPMLPEGATHVPAFLAIAPVFGQHAHVALSRVIVDLPLIQSLAPVYDSSLRVLELINCAFQEDMLPAWQATLSGLPAVHRVQLTECFYDFFPFGGREATMLFGVVDPLATAMAQQPAGQCIEVVLPDGPLDMFTGYAQSGLAKGVDITAVRAVGVSAGLEIVDEGAVGVCLSITSKHMP